MELNNVLLHKLHQGPLPDPDTLKAYDDLLPGAASTIIKMASDEALHNRNLEVLAQESDALARDKKIEVERERINGILLSEQLGQVLGWLIAFFSIGAASWSMWADKSPVITLAFLGLPLTTIINALRK